MWLVLMILSIRLNALLVLVGMKNEKKKNKKVVEREK